VPFMSNPDLSSLGPALTDLGVLIGLLNKNGSSISLNTGWFSNPKTAMQSSFDWPNLQPLIEQLLGKAANPLDINKTLNESWYSIKTADAKGAPQDSGFYFVEKTVNNNALLGVGMQRQFTA